MPNRLSFWYVEILLFGTFLFQLLLFLNLQELVKHHDATIEKMDDIVAVADTDKTGAVVDTDAYWEYREVSQRGNYIVLANFVRRKLGFKFKNHSITLATTATNNFLFNVELLADFWEGPISVAVYSPGYDFFATLYQIAKFRKCGKSSVTNLVSWHIFFDTAHLPEASFSPRHGLFDMKIPHIESCQSNVTENLTKRKDYRIRHKLLFPINLARNIARENSATEWLLISDVELLPSPPTLIPDFLRLIRTKYNTQTIKHQVFVLPAFESSNKIAITDIPRTKGKLVQVYHNGLQKRKVLWKFHYFACLLCHSFPTFDKWLTTMDTGFNEDLQVFSSMKYFGIKAWEPFYISSYYDTPHFDERIFREHSLNKPVQASILCHLNYTFNILNNAFLVHKPGIKYGTSVKSQRLRTKALKIISEEVLPLQYLLYGRATKGCWQIPNSRKRLIN